MPLVQAKCTNCGAQLEVDKSKDAAVCQYCQSAFIVEKAIQNYNITNHISDSVVNIYTKTVYTKQSDDFVVRAGVLSKYKGATSDITIPDTVTTIAANAFSKCGEITVTIPPSVKKIEVGAFYNTWVHLIFQEGTQVLESSYQAMLSLNNDWSIASVTIPTTMVSIGILQTSSMSSVGMFESCYNLKTVTIKPGANVKLENTFSSCEKLTTFHFPASMEETGRYVLSRCQALTSVTMEEGVKTISTGAFYQCSALVDVEIPSSVQSIEGGAFDGCKALKHVDLPAGLKEISWGLFCHCPGLESINIPEGVTVIVNYAFAHATSLKEVTIPQGLKEIRSRAFCNCRALTELTIPEGVTEIGNEAFAGCTSLHTLHLPESLTTIGTDAFKGCSSLRTVETSLPKSMFKGSPYGSIMGCYLTTACMSHQGEGFDDNCYELTTLRGFRDTYLQTKYPEEIQGYYHLAPQIVEAIDRDDHAQAVWQRVYAELVMPAVYAIEQGQLDHAYHHYKTYTEKLQKQYISQ